MNKATKYLSWVAAVGLVLFLLTFNPTQDDHRQRIAEIGCNSKPAFCIPIKLGSHLVVGHDDYSLFSVGYLSLPGEPEPVVMSIGCAGLIFGRDRTVSTIW